MPGFWRKCRIAFRWTRYLVWLLVVLSLLALAWVNVVGFPDFLKTRLVTSMRERGVQLEFSRMRWRFIHGVVAENVIIGDRQNREGKPLFTAGQIQLRLDYSALIHRRFQLAGVVVRDGIFTLPITPTNRLAALNMQAEVRFLPGDTWALDELRADFSGAKILLAGQVAHAPAAAGWEVFAGKKGGSRGALAHPLRDFSDTLAKIRFAAPPQISAQVFGDARDVHSFTLRFNAAAPGVTTPWFAAHDLQVAANLTAPTNAPVDFDAALDFWTNALPFRLAWITRASHLELTNFSAIAVECAGVWNAPQLSVSKLSARFGSGRLDAAASLDVVTRGLAFTNNSAFDPHALKPFLPGKARQWLAEVLWTQLPYLAVEGAVTLPVWTNRAPDWREILGGAARMRGEFAATNAVVRGQAVELARTHFSYRNLIWSAPDLKLVQGRTQLEFSGEESTATENFHCAMRGNIDAETVRPFLPTNVAGSLFKIVALAEPVALNVDASGNLRKLNSLAVTGRLALTNFAVRGQAYESVATDFSYANHVLEFLHPQSLRANGTQTMTADAVALDWNAGMYFFTNGYSTTMPMAMIRCLGPKTAALIEPYEFLSPPTVRVHGQLPLRDLNRGKDMEGTDMTFEIIRGAPFRWSKLATPNITGTVCWQGQFMVLTNVAAPFYGGDCAGHAYFDFRPTNYACNFSFGFVVTNVDVHLLGVDLSDSKTNLIEGFLTGRAVVTDADSRTWRSWNGYGRAQLRDGLLWNIPVFGLFSPVLNTVTPGLGNSRATEARARFVMTNGVARFDSVEIQTLTMRLDYNGTVDLQQNVDARVTAQLMRNMPVIGSVISLVLSPVSKIFECQVNGKVTEPRVTPIYFPFSRYLLNPVRSFEWMLPADEKPKG